MYDNRLDESESQELEYFIRKKLENNPSPIDRYGDEAKEYYKSLAESIEHERYVIKCLSNL